MTPPAFTPAPAGTEEALQVAVAAYLDAVLPGLWWHTPNGGHRSKAVAAKLKAAGVKPGVYDVIICAQRRSGGYVTIAIELKAAGNGLTAAQRGWAAMVTRAGWVAAVARSVDEVRWILANNDVATRERVA